MQRSPPPGPVPEGDAAAVVAETSDARPQPSRAESRAADPGGTDAPSAEGRLFDRIRQRHPKLGGALTQCRLAALEEARLTIEVRGNGFQAGLMQRNRKVIETVCREVLGRDLALTLDVVSPDATEDTRRRHHRNGLKQEALNHPLVAEAIEIFDGQVLDVRILEGEQE